MTKGIIDILINDSTIQSLVGEKSAQEGEYKVYPLIVTEKEVSPYIVVRTISKPSIPCKGQAANAFTPVATVACYHQVYEDCLALAAAVKTALDNKAAGTYNGINFSYLRYVDSSEDWIINTDGVGLYVVLPQFEAQINESTPT